MSIASEGQRPLMSARDVRTSAAAWLERRVSGSWSVDDQAELDAWLAQSPLHMTAYLRVDAAWNRTQRLAVLHRPASDVAGRSSWVLPLMLKIAAGFATLAVLTMVAANYLQRPQERTYSTPLGGRETIAFSDGTRIELNTDTVLRTRMTAAERIVWIDRGEAFFRVKHDSTHPFIVIAGNRRVTDLGTAFLVRRDPARLEVAVMQGRVRFEAPSAQSASVTALLTPGDVATATAGTMLVTRKADAALAHELGWRRGMLILDDVTLADAVDEFNRYNREKLAVSDAVVGMRIGGTFRTSDVQLFARVVQDVLGLHVHRRGTDTLISR